MYIVFPVKAVKWGQRRFFRVCRSCSYISNTC